MTPHALAKTIDHALLQPNLTNREFDAGCDVAVKFGVKAVCVKSADVGRAFNRVSSSSVGVCAVVGFPHGNTRVEVTALEAKLSLDQGATEIDVVVPLSATLSHDFPAVESYVRTLNECVVGQGGILKVIFETGLIVDPALKIKLCEICRNCGVAFVKTSTGFATARGSDGVLRQLGATVDDVQLLVKHARPTCEVKASGGIRTLAEVRRYLELGATRVGTASTAAILAETE